MQVNWSRTSRTDKGVSAAANVIAFDVPHACLRADQQRGQPHQQHQQERAAGSAAAGSSGNSTAAGGSGAAGGDAELAGLVARLNGALRAPIRVWGGVRVGQSFDARRVACGRRCAGEVYTCLPAAEDMSSWLFVVPQSFANC